MKILLILGTIIFVVSSVLLTHFLDKKNWLPNRFILGISVFLVIILPTIIFPAILPNFKIVLYLISGILTIMFFEATRLKIERNEYRGLVNYDSFKNDKNK